MATCPMCNADVEDDGMDQHKQETHPEDEEPKVEETTQKLVDI